MNRLIKLLVPFSFRQTIKGWGFRLIFLKRDIFLMKKALHYCNTFNNDRNAVLAGLLVKSHVLEKGITMPNRRLGFGLDRVRELLADCNTVISRFGCDSMELQSSLADLKQYYDIHKEGNSDLPSDIEHGIKELLPYLKLNDDNCYEIARSEYFQKSNDYREFALSRHSVRWFSEEPIDKESLLKAIELAQTAPSACNRQSTRVRIIESPDKKKVCEKLQNGNRGFGHSADKWLLITTDLSAWAYRDVNSAYIDGGIFTMSLLNALHYYGIVACTLNAHLNVDELKQLQKEICFSDSEIPICFIVIGNAPEDFMVAKSRRKDIKEIISFV